MVVKNEIENAVLRMENLWKSLYPLFLSRRGGQRRSGCP